MSGATASCSPGHAPMTVLLVVDVLKVQLHDSSSPGHSCTGEPAWGQQGGSSSSSRGSSSNQGSMNATRGFDADAGD
jgi:hypothetical protein